MKDICYNLIIRTNHYEKFFDESSNLCKMVRMRTKHGNDLKAQKNILFSI